ncbi:MAG: hypothetical protein PUC71_06165 [Oscillospiraceae bacterium]|jgi:hypothetical protein|nr:hypothetical protein [Oscillospiraceae bacterium]
MDDRRRTISSEENMIGEALMRVSNTLEAERLTKSLDYQEKLRSRSNIRLIIAVVCLIIAIVMMIIGGTLLVVLVKYEDPVLDTLVPFLKSFFNGINTIFQSAVESSTYLPALTRLGTEALGSLVTTLQSLNNIDLSQTMQYLTDILGTTNGLLTELTGGLGTLNSSAASLMGDLGPSLSRMMNGGLVSDISNGISSAGKSLGINGKDIANINSNLVSSLSTLSDTVASPSTQSAVKGVANSTANLANSSADLLNNLNTAASAFNNNVDYSTLGSAAGKTANATASIINSTADIMNGVTGALSRVASLFS